MKSMLERFQGTVYRIEKGMPPWLRRSWVATLLFVAVLLVFLAGLIRFLTLFERGFR